MRDIKFRGLYNGQWVYGCLLYGIGMRGKEICQIEHVDASEHRVYDVPKESVGEFTGLQDKNGKDIYEGDIIKRYTGYTFESKIREYRLGEINQAKSFGYDWHESDEVIGNIYEKPELLK